MRRLALGMMLALAACSPGGGAADTAVPPTTPGAAVLVDRFVAEIVAGDADAAFAQFADDAMWTLGDVELRLGEPLGDGLAWLQDVVGVDAATTDAVVRGLLGYLVALRTEPAVTGCAGSASMVRCSYVAQDALAPVFGAPQPGTVTVGAQGGRITGFHLDAEVVRAAMVPSDAFRRWAAVVDPDATRDLSLLARAEAIVPAAVAWDAAGRPDVASPVPGADPVAVVEAFLMARNEGDWTTMVALMGGEALGDPFGSHDEFEAAQLLERDIMPVGCQVILESAAGSRVGCEVAVTDMIVQAAGIVATNPNQTTFEVHAGRVTGLPQFIPSSFLAERAIEEWAAANASDAYRRSCPDGIAGQSPIDGLPCARFIVEHHSSWEPLVAALDL